MRRVGQTIIEIAAVLAIGTLLAFAANAVRGEKNSVRFGKDYFPKAPPAVANPAPDADRADASTSQGDGLEPAGAATASSEPTAERTSPPTAAEPDTPAAAQPAANPAEEKTAEVPKHFEHPYNDITMQEIADLLDDPAATSGAVVIVDARDDEHYEAGHIPGALQCDHYRIKLYLDPVLERAMGAEKVIVYCNGGDCEDSLFVCNDLVEAGVPMRAIYLYAGGWKEWSKGEAPIATGRE